MPTLEARLIHLENVVKMIDEDLETAERELLRLNAERSKIVREMQELRALA